MADKTRGVLTLGLGEGATSLFLKNDIQLKLKQLETLPWINNVRVNVFLEIDHESVFTNVEIREQIAGKIGLKSELAMDKSERYSDVFYEQLETSSGALKRTMSLPMKSLENKSVDQTSNAISAREIETHMPDWFQGSVQQKVDHSRRSMVDVDSRYMINPGNKPFPKHMTVTSNATFDTLKLPAQNRQAGEQTNSMLSNTFQHKHTKNNRVKTKKRKSVSDTLQHNVFQAYAFDKNYDTSIRSISDKDEHYVAQANMPNTKKENSISDTLQHNDLQSYSFEYNSQPQKKKSISFQQNDLIEYTRMDMPCISRYPTAMRQLKNMNTNKLCVSFPGAMGKKKPVTKQFDTSSVTCNAESMDSKGKAGLQLWRDKTLLSNSEKCVDCDTFSEDTGPYHAIEDFQRLPDNISSKRSTDDNADTSSSEASVYDFRATHYLSHHSDSGCSHSGDSWVAKPLSNLQSRNSRSAENVSVEDISVNTDDDNENSADTETKGELCRTDADDETKSSDESKSSTCRGAEAFVYEAEDVDTLRIKNTTRENIGPVKVDDTLP